MKTFVTMATLNRPVTQPTDCTALQSRIHNSDSNQIDPYESMSDPNSTTRTQIDGAIFTVTQAVN